MRIAVVGGPGSGKATLTSMLAEAYALPLVSVPTGATEETELAGGIYSTIGAMRTKRPEPEPTEAPAAAEAEAEAEAEPEADADADADAEPEAEVEAEPEAEVQPAAARAPDPLLADSKGWVVSLDSSEMLALLVSLGVVPDKIIVLEAPVVEEESAEDPLAALRMTRSDSLCLALSRSVSL